MKLERVLSSTLLYPLQKGEMGKRILVVDDDPHLRTLLNIRLKHLGYDVLLAEDAIRALEIIEDTPPDLVVADIMMPRMDGYQFLQKFRQTPGFENIPFLFLSAKTLLEDRIKGLRFGADDYIAKPFNFKELVAKIEVLLERAQRYQTFAIKALEKYTSGDLQIISLVELLQMLAYGKKTVRLTLTGEEEGEIYSYQGKVVEAICGAKKGEEAFYHLLGFDKGRFAMKIDVKPPTHSIDKGLSQLLLEGVKRRDEIERIRQSLPDFSLIPFLREEVEDRELAPLLDGKRNLSGVIKTSPRDDLEILRTIKSWYEKGILVFKSPEELKREETFNLLVVSSDRENRDRLFKKFLEIGKGGELLLSNFVKIQLSESVNLQLYGLPYLPSLLEIFSKKASGFLVLLSNDRKEVKSTFDFFRTKNIKGIVLKIDGGPGGLEGAPTERCDVDNLDEVEKILEGFVSKLRS